MQSYYYSYCIMSFSIVNLLTLLNYFRDSALKATLSFMVVTIFAIFLGARGVDVGIDTMNYMLFFSGETGDFLISEPFFRIFSFLGKNFYPVLSFVLISILFNIFFLLSFKNLTPHYPLAMALFISTFVYLNSSINIIRQGLAMSLFAFGLSMSIGYKARIGIFGAASSTHYSAALVAFVALSLSSLNFSIGKKIIGMLLVSLMIYFLDIVNVLRLLSGYSDAAANAYWILTWEKISPWRVKHVHWLIFLLIVLVIFTSYKRNGNASIVVKSSVSFVVTGYLLVFFFRAEEMFADRIFYYFVFLIPILIIYIIFSCYGKFFRLFLSLFLPNIWLLKTVLLQYPGWFLPPFEAIR